MLDADTSAALKTRAKAAREAERGPVDVVGREAEVPLKENKRTGRTWGMSANMEISFVFGTLAMLTVWFYSRNRCRKKRVEMLKGKMRACVS